MLLTVGAVAVCAALLVAWPSPAAAAATLRVSSPAPYQVFQRGSDGLGDIAVTGVCRGPRSSRPGEVGRRHVAHGQGAGGRRLQLRHQGHARRPALPRGAGAVGAGGVAHRPLGRRRRHLRHRWAEQRQRPRPSLDSTSQNPVLQRGPVRQRRPLEGAPRPGRLSGAAGGQREQGSAGCTGRCGRCSPPALMAAEAVPVAFVPCAKSTRASAAGFGTPTGPTRGHPVRLHGPPRRRAVGGVRAVLFWQGEADARAVRAGDGLRGGPEHSGGRRAPRPAACRSWSRRSVTSDVRYTATGVNGHPPGPGGRVGPGDGRRRAGAVRHRPARPRALHAAVGAAARRQAVDGGDPRRRGARRRPAGTGAPAGRVRRLGDGGPDVRRARGAAARRLRGRPRRADAGRRPASPTRRGRQPAPRDVSVYLLAPVTEPLRCRSAAAATAPGGPCRWKARPGRCRLFPSSPRPWRRSRRPRPALVAPAGPSASGRASP